MVSSQKAAAQAADEIVRLMGSGFDALLVLGSGWGDAIGELGEFGAQVPTSDIYGFPPSRVAGHSGVLADLRQGALRLLVLRGRVHLYEGHSPAAVTHGVRAAAALGCRVAIFTNAAGGVNPAFSVGQPVIITDHLNFTGESPLAGPEWGNDRFVDLVDAYSPRLVSLAAEVDPGAARGVYAGLRGPHFETAAEIRMLRTLGADLVGMSTVLETIAARHCEMEVLGVSLVTNLAAGLATEGPSHAEVLAAGEASAAKLGRLLRGVLERL